MKPPASGKVLVQTFTSAPSTVLFVPVQQVFNFAEHGIKVGVALLQQVVVVRVMVASVVEDVQRLVVQLLSVAEYLLLVIVVQRVCVLVPGIGSNFEICFFPKYRNYAFPFR